uniref:Uncharacterized protein n=1 Tax=Zooxanthella nutricula TaxID=1333877 RepID=A0A7S2Q083_9DINO|mmetsp:Transcript_73924/g.226090  ORF Transcript_73924/g.226090 Transcript_73924/m.226090 type:complete len:144 (+) Transcript_73924:103-534(+)
MRWAGAASSDAPAAPAPSPGDRRRAEEILANFHAGPIEGPGGGPGDGPTAAAAEAARPDADEIARALAALRHRMAQRFVLCAGESISAKEFKASATELARTFLEEAGLHEVIGIERWARETAEVAAQDAARIFQVQVAIAAPN